MSAIRWLAFSCKSYNLSSHLVIDNPAVVAIGSCYCL